MMSMSFVIELSQKQFYGVLGKQGTINSDYIDSALIICDNAVIHKRRIIKTFLSNNSVGILTIYPYSPFLNLIETLIGVVKNNIRVDLKQQRTLYLQFIQKCIYEALKINPLKFTEASIKKTESTISAIRDTLCNNHNS